ncbi:MAG: hypothetical protein HKN58_11820 [Xanthomonadales bacterium]|nr:hypothetical protein [Xanthomonadales bacterium]
MKSLLVFLLLVLASLPALAQSNADYHYSGQVFIDPASGHLRADWLITVLDETATKVEFKINDSLGNFHIAGSGVASGSVVKESGFGRWWTLRVTLAEPAPYRVIQLSYDGVLLPEPMDNGINSIGEERIELSVDSFWFPIDERFAQEFSADLDLRIGEDGWQGVTTGEITAIDGGFRIHNADPRMDIALTLAKEFHVTEADGFTVYDQREHREGTDRLLAAARFCVDFLNSHFGADDPLPVGKILVTERAESGYARENYIVFTDIAETEPAPMTRFVCHEFAHYWASGAKFDTVDNWINEALAEYLGALAVRTQLGQEAFEDMLEKFREQIAEMELPHVWKQGDTERTPYLVQYRKAPLLLAELEQRIGAKLFIEFVRAYFESEDKTTPGLLAVLEDVAGTDHRDAFEEMLGQ